MLKWMDSMLAEDKYVAVHVDDYNSVEECWEPVTQVYQPFKSRVNKLWKQVYWRKDQLVGSFKGELFTYDNDNVRLHTETFPVFREEEWDCRIDKVRLFVEDSSGGGSMDWSQGRVIAPVDANTEWEYSSYVDTFEVLSWSNLNDQNAVIYQNNVDDYVTITVQSPWNNVYDGEADGWSADVEFTNFDEAILINQYMNGSTLRERFIFARKGDFYFGIVRWDTASKIGDQWHISRRAVGLKTKQDIDFGFDGFYERSRRDNWIAFYGDSNYNGFLDMSDISEFMINWQKQGGVTLGWDIDGDEIVNFQDYALMLLGYGN
jgi:hypothetical protein